MRPGWARLASRLLLCALLPALTGCSGAGYLLHLGWGQMGVLLDRERLTPERLAALTPEEQHGYAVLQEALAYGAGLGLARTTSYRHLIDRPPERALRVLVAAPPQRLEPLTWWFPITGRVAYRGYFDASRASAFADALRANGYETYVRPALLYSTLGWFDDPVPRSLLVWPDWAIVDTILHELVHETVFVPGDVAYDESLATFVAHRATEAFFADRPDQAEAAVRAFRDDLRFAGLLDGLRAELQALYASAPDDAHARLLSEALGTRRVRIFARYQTEVWHDVGWETHRYDAFPERTLSNAYVIAHRTYLGDLPCLEHELAALADLRALILAHVRHPGRRADCPEPEQDAR